MNVYETLSKIDVSEFTEKKGSFTYLSWANAVDILLQHFPEATWDVVRNESHVPYACGLNGAFVTVWVEINGIRRTISHPVLDYRNKSVDNPDSFVVNTSIQRALAKCISLHGLGLYIYRGEDLPEAPKGQIDPATPINQKHVDGAFDCYIEEITADQDEPNYERMQKADSRLTDDEKGAVMDKVQQTYGKDQFPGTKKLYTTVINDCLKHHPADES